MTRRLGIAIVGMVIAALVLAGVGTLVLAAVIDREAAEQELIEQSEALSALLSELTFATPANAEGGTVRQRLRDVARTISVEGIGIVVLPRDGGAPLGGLPVGLEVEDFDLDAIRRKETISGAKDNLIWAAASSTNRAGMSQMLVLTRERDPILLPAFRWWAIASIITVGLAIALTLRLSRRLTAPIRDTASTASRIAAGDLSARAEPSSRAGEEVEQLIHSINTMAATLDRSRALERQFLLSVSHDLRTPLTSIRGYGEALADGAVNDPVHVGVIIEGEAKRLERLVGDLLLLARLEGTGFEYHTATVDLGSLVDAATVGVRHEAEQRSVAITVRTPDEPARIQADPDRYSQVIGNLVGNALRFAQETVVVRVWKEDGGVHLSVADDGPGISNADLPHVFERLYVAKDNPSIKESGSGLGLAIVRELTEGMGGSVLARRSSFGGAEFVVSFPSAP
jgi:signal transduction histidine kinase